MVRLVFWASALLALGLAAPTSFARTPPKVDRPNAAATEWPAYLDEVASSGADVVFLGERHDNDHHHFWQAAAVAGLEARMEDKRGVAGLVFEMIAEEAEPEANRARDWPSAASDAQSLAVGDAVGWTTSGWPDFALYAPILKAAPRAFIGGAGYTRGALMRAANAPDWLSKEPQARRLGLDRPLPEALQKSREQAQIVSHCNAIPASVAPMMVDAQRARDGRLARAILRARDAARREGRSGPVVVITGSGHARLDYGAPAMLALAKPELKIVALAFVEPGGLDQAALARRFHAWAETPAPSEPRGDPCAAFKSRKKPAQE